MANLYPKVPLTSQGMKSFMNPDTSLGKPSLQAWSTLQGRNL